MPIRWARRSADVSGCDAFPSVTTPLIMSTETPLRQVNTIGLPTSPSVGGGEPD
jgi:hypothetical protein